MEWRPNEAMFVEKKNSLITRYSVTTQSFYVYQTFPLDALLCRLSYSTMSYSTRLLCAAAEKQNVH